MPLNVLLDSVILIDHFNGWKLPDAFQAALAQHHHLRFATRNIRDFLPERHAFVVVPYKR